LVFFVVNKVDLMAQESRVDEKHGHIAIGPYIILRSDEIRKVVSGQFFELSKRYFI